MRHNRKPSGVTMVELLITMPLIILGSILLYTAVDRGWQAYLFASAQTKANYEAVGTLDRVSRVIRSTNKIIAATPNDLTIECYFSPRDLVPDHARYYMQDGLLMVDIIPASGTAPNYTYLPADTKTYTITSIKNTGSDSVFQYLDENEANLGGSPDISAIRQIGILLVTNPNPKILPTDQRASTKVQIRNLKTNL